MVIAVPNIPTSLPADVQADIQAVADAAASGKPVDPAVVHRIRELAELVRDSVYRRHGLLDVGVPAIREIRGDLPES